MALPCVQRAKWTESVLHWSDRLLALLFPPRCVVRGCASSSAWLCPGCEAGIVPVPGPVCHRCGAPEIRGWCPDCRGVDPPFEALIAAGLYVTPLRDVIQALKYRGIQPLAPVLARLVAPRVARAAPSAVVVAVPSHPRRVAERGLDHTRLVAREVARSANLVWAPDLVERTRVTAPQVGLERGARRANVDGAFRVRGVAPPRVVLVDDVVTTGATATSCSKALLAAGARHVVVCAIARAASMPAKALGRPDAGRV